MRLADYLQQRKLSPGKFAEEAGISRGSVRAILEGRSRGGPRVDTAEKIVLATGGIVSFSDLVQAERPTSGEAA